ncbi:MAG TPA: hypothetical protein VD861_03905 [Pyrinomonadaceae bacterium]|nr:hypothetical protein [Pyrinomonadaceae bacterium]
MRESSTSGRHFSPRASLATIGLKLRQLDLFKMIRETVRIRQKTVKHSPAKKLYDAFVAILAGAHGLNEINSRLRSDEVLQRAFGRARCAEYSVVQDTLDACTPENVEQMRRALNSIFREHAKAARHDYGHRFQFLDIDMSGLPCGPQAELSRKGYFSRAGIRYGRQLGRVIASLYEEVVVDQTFVGNIQLTSCLRPLLSAAEEVLQLDYDRRTRTLLRMDAGGGTLDDLNWCLARGYQLHCKDISSKRAEAWAATAREWFEDPYNPDREFGWVIPGDSLDYVHPVKRLAIRWRKRNGQLCHQMLISTLEPREVMELLGRPTRDIYEPELVAPAYAQLYDQRAGAIEIEFKEDKQGVGLTKRRKKRAAAQQMIVLLNSLAHNVLVWARGWLSAEQPKARRYGILRLVRDVFGVSGFIESNEEGEIKRLVLNKGSAIARSFLVSFQALLRAQGVIVELGST